MAWNEPGGNGKDPWGNRRNDGPPDLDEVFRNLQSKLSGLFGGGGNSSGGSFGFSLGLIILVFAFAWVLFGIYIVDEGERGVVLTFGKHTDTTQPGPHWYAPIIQTKEVVQVTEVRKAPGEAQVLTGDENIVNIEYTVLYKLKDPADYLFNVFNPVTTLQQAAESAFREIIGKNTLDFIIKDGRDVVIADVKALLQDNLDFYGTGLDINNISLTKAQPPQEVQAALDDANKAREDKDRYIKEAEAYRNDIIPKARGNARQQVEQAKGYKVKVTKSAEGEADRFLKLLKEYERAPKVTRERLYLETVEEVMANSGKVLVDVEGGNNLMYLPLDKITSGRGRVYFEPLTGGDESSSGSTQTRPLSGRTNNSRSNLRKRGER